MAEFEKPMGFTAVNGRQPSPPRSHPVEAQTPKEAGASATPSNGVHPAPEARHTPPAAEERPAPAVHIPQPPLYPHPIEREPAKPDNPTPNSDRSPNRKRTYPEAFAESNPNTPQYPPRSAPPREAQEYRPQEHRSPDSNHHDVPHQGPAHYASGPVQAGSPYSTDPGLDDSDRRTMEALKANSGTASPPRDQYDIRGGDGDDDDDEEDDQDSAHMGHLMGQGGTPTRSAAGVITKDSTKRKRVFSNRTKTGCLTCRKRKKKCDEKHPECNNCVRGGFVCEGYTPRASWQKPTQSQQRIPPLAQIQSKGPGMAPQRHNSLNYLDTPQDFARPELRHEEPPRRDLSLPGMLPHPQQDAARQPYPRSDSRYPAQGLAPRYEPDAREHNVHNGPPHEPGHYPPPPPPPPPPPSAFPSHHAALHHGAPPAPMHQQGPATDMARAALDHVPSTQPPAFAPVNGSSAPAVATRRPGQPSERDKMLQGEYHVPYTPVLMADRNQCAQAVYRFNQACQNPTLAFAHADRERLFREIVMLRPTPDQPVAGSPMPKGTNEETDVLADVGPPRGSVGPGCIVEAPFHCDYGYNLTVGADVVIGAHCRISDICHVNIGNGVVISPAVTIMCSTYAIDPKERRRGKGQSLGRGIVIEDEAWIGTGCVILPGVRIGKCSTVGAGTMVHKVGSARHLGLEMFTDKLQDVPPFTVVAGNPPKVVRPINNRAGEVQH